MKNRNLIDLISVTILTKLSLNENACNKLSTIFEGKLHIINAASIFLFVNLFNLSSLQNTTLCYIERCFTVLVENESFLELEFKLISKILASSTLLITSEIEVFKIANRWLNHNIEERSKYAEDLLLKVRLHLLSTETILNLLKNSKIFDKDDVRVNFLNKTLDCKEKKLCKSISNHTSRYCNQNYFKQMVLGGYNLTTSITSSNVSCIDLNKVGDVEAYPPMKMGRHFLEVVYLKGDIYVFGGLNKNKYWIKSVEKYSLTSKTWSKVAEMNDDRDFFCVCAFIDKILIIGRNKDRGKTSSCLQLDTSDYSWKEVAKMNEARSSASCAVFEE